MSPLIQSGLCIDSLPNLSLNRTRVRRASCGARRHAPVSLVR
jgi:hypothetical protein